MSDRIEDRLLGEARDVLNQLKTGISPTDALFKTAERDNLSDDMVRTIGGMVNQVLSVKLTKEGQLEFPLIDAESVVAKRQPAEKTAEVKLPTGDFSAIDLPSSWSPQNYNVPAHLDAEYRQARREAKSCIEKHTMLIKEAFRQTTLAKMALDKAVEDTGRVIRRLSDKDMQKMARLTVNGYQDLGQKMLFMLSERSGRKFPVLEKTADAAVFPAAPEYIKLGVLHDAALKFIDAEHNLDQFMKYAEGIGDLAQSLDEYVLQSLDSGRKDDLTDSDNVEKQLDPDVRNALKEVKTRNQLASLMLYDPDLKQFSMPTLIAAYNAAVSNAPEIADNTSAMKTVMLQRINAGNLADISQLKQEMELGKTIREKTKLKSDVESNKLKNKALKAEKKTSLLSPLAIAGAPGKAANEFVFGAKGSSKKESKPPNKPAPIAPKDKEKASFSDEAIKNLAKKMDWGRLREDYEDKRTQHDPNVQVSAAETSPAAVEEVLTKWMVGEALSPEQDQLLEAIRMQK